MTLASMPAAVSAARDLAEVTRSYGYVGPLGAGQDQPCIVMWDGGGQTGVPGIRWVAGEPGAVLRQAPVGWRKWWPGETAAQYPTKLPYACLEGPGLEPVWVSDRGAVVVAWAPGTARPTLLVGLDVAGEIVRCRQGDASRVHAAANRSGYGFGFERPTYLFEHQLAPGLESTPVADVLGFWWAETLSGMSGLPLVEPLPGGARGLVLLTGDDDQADLTRYARQLEVIGAVPITYYLHPLTHHTPETLAALPPTVDYGVHVDAVDAPAEYTAASRAQCRQIRALCGRPARTVRNHGYLNDGYLGHLRAWESDGLRLDLNIPGVDGTALTGSFLPFKVRRQDGSWSDHFCLLTAFGDGMLYALKLTAAAAAARIHTLADQVERRHPGVLVFNMHPQNIIDTETLHAAILSVASRPGWAAMTAEQYLDWIDLLDGLRADADAGGLVLRSDRLVKGLVVRRRTRFGWSRQALPDWTGVCHVPGQK